MPIFLFFLFFLSACATETGGVAITNEVPEGTESPPGLASLPNPQSTAAEAMDRFLSARMTAEETKEEKKKCQANKNENAFCYTWLHYPQLARVIGLRNRVPVFPEPKVTTPVVLEWDGNKLKNENKVRKEKIPNLLKGMAGWTPEQVRTLAQISLKEKHCPNNLAIVAAATMEDYLPDKVGADEIARLYEHGGRCSRRGSPDYENFYTRAGLLYLYKGDSKGAIKALGRLRPRDATSGRVQYWKFRAYRALNDKKRAQKALDDLLAHYRFSFHALIARGSADEMTQKFLDPKPVLLSQSKRMKPVNDLIKQIALLKEAGFTSSASILAEWAISKFPKTEPEVKMYIASQAEAQLGVLVTPDLVSRHSNLLGKQAMELLYPRPYSDAFQKQKDLVDPFLLWAVARKESRFDTRAVSPANAQGLLQLQPKTAKRYLTTGGEPNLLNPDINAEAAAHYLADLLKMTNGQVPLALAMYNAGEDAVLGWKNRYFSGDPILVIDLIPYRETRDYVGSVLSNYFWYRRLYVTAGQSTETDPFQGLIPPGKGQLPINQPAEKHSSLSPLGAFHRSFARRNRLLLTPN